MTDIPKTAREVYYDAQGEPIAYCPEDGIGVTDLERGAFWSMQDKQRMRELAARARAKEADPAYEGQRFVVVCIDVDDSGWRRLVDHLMPGADWQQYRDRGERPVARGVVPRDFIAKVIADLYPAAGRLRDDVTNVVVFASGGIAIVPDEP